MWKNDTIKINIYIYIYTLGCNSDSWEWLENTALLHRKKFPLKFEHVSQPFPGEFIQDGPFPSWITSVTAHSDASASYATSQDGWQSMKGARQNIAVIIIFRRPNKNSPVQQQTLKMLPSWPNVFSIPVKHSAVNSPKFLSRNCWNVVADVVSQLFQSVRICFIHFILQSKNYTCLINLLFLTILWPFIQTFSKHVSWVSHLKDFLGEISSLTPISLNFLSVSTVYFLSGFCLAIILLFSAYWPSGVYFVYMGLDLLKTGTKIFCDTFQ